MDLLLTLLSAVCWTIVYGEAIRKAFKDKTYGMPLFALALNITWESLYTYRDFQASPVPIQGWVNLVWVLLDIGIVYTYFQYGKKEFSDNGNAKYFLPWSILAFVMSLAVQYAFLIEFGDNAPKYSAFLQNLIMSILFIAMLERRRSPAGQNQIIAVAKWLGTLAPTILFGIIHPNQLVLVLGAFCSVFDLIYIYYLSTFSTLRSPQ